MLQASRRAPVGARRVRSVLFAVTVVALAIAAHAVGGGGRPDSGTIVIVTVLIAAAAHSYGGRGASPVGVVVALAGGQLAMHLMLDASAGHDGPTAPVAGGWRMFLAHVVATVITAVLLAKADDALCALYTLVRLILPVCLALPTPEEPVRRPLPAPTTDLVRQVLLRVSCARRGPPCPR